MAEVKRGYFEDKLARHYRLKMKRYSHHKIRLYLGFLIAGTIIILVGIIVTLSDFWSRMSHFEPTLTNALGIAGICVGLGMVMAYEEIQRWCSKGPVLDLCEYGIVGYDENAVKGKCIPITSTWEEIGERQLSRAFWGKKNGQAKVPGMDGGKGDGFMGGEYCWVREKRIDDEWVPYMAWSVQRGIIGEDQVKNKTTEQILADIERDEPFIQSGEKTYLSTFLFRVVTIIKPDSAKGRQGRTEIPLQIAELMWNDPDWRDYSPVIYAYDTKTMFGGFGSKISSSDQFRLAALEDETIDKTIEIGQAQASTTRISNIASSRVKAEYEELKQRGIIRP